MVPDRIQAYFEIIHQANNRGNNLIEGRLSCCNSHDFEVRAVGEIKTSVFSKMYLYPENDKTAIEVCCRKCGKVITVFDSECDGYGRCGKKQHTHLMTKTVACRKCRSEDFSVGIEYEYPDIQELEELGISEIDNAFTWIWITLECNNCGTMYKRFVDCETT